MAKKKDWVPEPERIERQKKSGKPLYTASRTTWTQTPTSKAVDEKAWEKRGKKGARPSPVGTIAKKKRLKMHKTGKKGTLSKWDKARGLDKLGAKSWERSGSVTKEATGDVPKGMRGAESTLYGDWFNKKKKK